MTKPTPFFVLALVTIILTVLSVWMISTIYTTAMDRQAAALLRTTSNWEPPRITCKRPEQELWDCIRYVE